MSNILPRFTVNYLLNKNSDLLQEHSKYFSNHAETRITFMLSNNQQLTKNEFFENVSLDDFSILQNYFEQWGSNFYDCVDFKPLISNLQYNATLGAHLLNHLSVKRISDFAFCEETLAERNLTSNVNLVGITKIKDEGDLPNIAIRNWLEVCDQLIISDASNCSTIDSELCNSPRVKIIKQVQPYHEKLVYDQLYYECRQLGATHILHFDVDEMLDPKANSNHLRTLISKMSKGEALAVSLQVFNLEGRLSELDYERTFQKNSFHRLLAPNKDLIFCDDGHSSHCNLAQHCPTIPEKFPIQRFYLNLKMYHLEGTVMENVISKFNSWWDADYNSNQNTELAFKRYLPKLLKHLSILSPRSVL